jgi:hypothetical protein
VGGGRHDITDISSSDELISYAARAQLALVHDQASQNTVAWAIGMGRSRAIAGSNLAHALTNGSLSDEYLQKLDEVVAALAPRDMGHIGSLSSLAVLLRGLRDRESLAGRVPPIWTREILQSPADTESEVLTHASALLGTFLAAEAVDRTAPASRGAVKTVRERYQSEILQVVQQLILIGEAPPTPQNVEALIMLGTLGSYAFDIMKRRLEQALVLPLGFRVWRAIAKLVTLIKPTSPYKRELIKWVEQLLEQAEDLRMKSIYPARSLDLELAMAIPSAWSPPEADWVGRALLARANNTRATVQERGTAALGLWQRAVQQGRDREKVISDLEPLIMEFEDKDTQRDAMGWVAANLKHVITENTAVSNTWPKDIGGPWLQHIGDAVRNLELQGIPDHILPATVTLFRHVLLQNASVFRRQAIETLLAGGWAEPVTSALEKYLELERSETWIRVRAEFALGFLQHPDSEVAGCLAATCTGAYRNLSSDPTPAQIMEMHTALFAIGDCFGAVNVSQQEVCQVRDNIRDVLRGLVDSDLTHNQALYPVARAAAYVLTFTAQPRKDGERDIAEELLEKLCDHPDGTTSSLSTWALRHRINVTTGEIRPLVHAKHS